MNKDQIFWDEQWNIIKEDEIDEIASISDHIVFNSPEQLKRFAHHLTNCASGNPRYGRLPEANSMQPVD